MKELKDPTTNCENTLEDNAGRLQIVAKMVNAPTYERDRKHIASEIKSVAHALITLHAETLKQKRVSSPSTSEPTESRKPLRVFIKVLTQIWGKLKCWK